MSSGSGKTTPGKNTSSKTTSNKSEPGQRVSKQHEGRRERERGHGGVGVGLNVDLGGVGQRKAEPNPFATTNVPSSSQTQEKPKTKKIDRSIDTTFDKVKLTGEQAKGEANPPGPINISDNVPSAPPAGPSTVEAPPTDKEKKRTTKQTTLADAIDKLPAGYKIVKGKTGFHAELDSVFPSLPLQWDGAKGVWTPPGFVTDPSDPDRIFNQTTGQNGVWDDKAGHWIDAKTGKPLTYEQ